MCRSEKEYSRTFSLVTCFSLKTINDKIVCLIKDDEATRKCSKPRRYSHYLCSARLIPRISPRWRCLDPKLLGGSNSSSICGKGIKAFLIMRRDAMTRYIILGTGIAGISYYSLQTYGSGSKEDQLKLMIISIVTAGLGYLGAKYIRVAHCEDKPSIDDDSLDKALRKVKTKVDEVKGDIKESIDKKADELWAAVKEKYVTDAARDAFEVVNEILGNLRDFGDLDKVSFETPLFILLALVKKAQDKLNREMMESLPKESQASYEQFLVHRRIAVIACKIYDASLTTKLDKQAEILGLSSEDDIIYAKLNDGGPGVDEHCPKFVICFDQETDSVVFAIRGTFSLTDIFIDIVCDDEEFLGGFAHRGILMGMRKMMEVAAPELRKYLEEEEVGNRRLIITGHSLGAGTAQLVAMEILSHPGKYIPADTVVHCVALAPPPIFRPSSDGGALPDSITDALHIYINSQDCVPRMSLGSVATLLAMLRAVDALPMTNYQKFQILAGVSGSGDKDNDEVAANLRRLEEAVMGVKQDRFPYLEHPGHIHYLYRGVGTPGVATRSSSPDPEGFLVVPERSQSFSKQIVLLERMVLDHLNIYYHQAFTKAIVEAAAKRKY